LIAARPGPSYRAETSTHRAERSDDQDPPTYHGRRVTSHHSRTLQRHEALCDELLKTLAETYVEIKRKFHARGSGEAAGRAWINHVLRYMTGDPDDFGPRIDSSTPSEPLY
jgi:hypothetical protein